MSDRKNIWPDSLLIRDTGLHDDIGGAGMRIYTTAGQGYEKREYVRADLLEANAAEIARQRQAKENWMDQYETLRAENEKLAIEVSRLEGVVYILNCRVNELRRASELELQLDDQMRLEKRLRETIKAKDQRIAELTAIVDAVMEYDSNLIDSLMASKDTRKEASREKA